MKTVKYRTFCPVCNSPVNEEDRCPKCGSPLFAQYEVEREEFRRILEKAKERRDLGVWAFKDILPVKNIGQSLGEGWTPTIKASRLAKALGVRDLYVKNEGLNPTGSFIDRGSAVEVERAKERGYKSLVASGLGDLTASLAVYSTAYGLKSIMFVERGSEVSRLYSIVLTGGEVIAVDDREEGFKRARRLSKIMMSYSVFPYSLGLLEGYRTLVFEVCIQGLRPDVVVVPVGDGILALSIYKAVEELRSVLRCEAKIVGARVEGGVGSSLSELSIKRPLALRHLEEVLKRGYGSIVKVSPPKVYKAMYDLASTQGIITDPPGAAGVAAVEELVHNKVIDKNERVLIVATGSGGRNPMLMLESLKAVKGGLKSIVEEPPELLSEPKVEILRIISDSGADYTYSIWKKLRELGLNLSIVTVYQHVKQLERKGLIRPVRRRDRRIFYMLTEKGYEVLSLLQ